MRKKIGFGMLVIIIVFTFYLFLQNMLFQPQEYILSEKDKVDVANLLNEYPDAVEVIGDTYRIYHTPNVSLIVGNRSDGMTELEKINKIQ